MIDVVLPVLNEASSIPRVLSCLPTEFRPIVVDNGSTDGSSDVARKFGADVIVEPRRGFGAACYAGLTAASADVVCFMDCDGSLDPAELPLVAAPVVSNKVDLMIGLRIPEPGAWSFHSRMANRFLAWEVSRRTGTRLNDLGPMRAAGRENLLALNMTDRRSGWPLEMMLKAAAAGWRIAEVGVTYRARSAGRSKETGTVSGTLRAVRDMSALLR
jgi:glycosyltransferase involved in cell wall biosynthesis